MALAEAGADRILEGIVAGTLYVALHSAAPTATNQVAGAGYQPVTIAAADWTLSTVGSMRRIANTDAVSFPTPGADWTQPTHVALWDRDPAQRDPVLIRSVELDVAQPNADALVVFAVGQLRFEARL